MKIEICHGQNCRDYGGKALAAELDNMTIAYAVIPCRSLCPHAPVVFIDNRLRLKVTAAELEEMLPE